RTSRASSSSRPAPTGCGSRCACRSAHARRHELGASRSRRRRVPVEPGTRTANGTIRWPSTKATNMTDTGLSDEAMKVALLMEAAQAQQRLSQESLERLAAHARDLDAVVRDE